MVCGANSDLFGRRYFILLGNVLVMIGSILGATSHHIGQTIAAHVLLGFGGGNCQLAAFALPELLPNKWRHFAVVIADALIYFDVIVGPVTARMAGAASMSGGYAAVSTSTRCYRAAADVLQWRWGYWALLIAQTISFVVLLLLYFPPKHPRGIPWAQAMRELDYVGIVSFTGAAAMILSGIVYVQLLPSNSPIVIGLLVAGFACLVSHHLPCSRRIHR